jgi:hypothetical protein
MGNMRLPFIDSDLLYKGALDCRFDCMLLEFYSSYAITKINLINCLLSISNLVRSMRFGIMSLGAKKSNSLNSKNISRTFSNIFEIPKISFLLRFCTYFNEE